MLHRLALIAAASISLALSCLATPAAAQSSPCTFVRQDGQTAQCTGVQEMQRSQYYTESIAPLGASATAQGSWRDAGASPSQWSTFNCLSKSDQGGIVYIQQSNDQVTLYNNQGTSSTANQPATATMPVYARYARCVVTNSQATAETSRQTLSRFGAN